MVFNLQGRLVGIGVSIGENSGAYRSCSTMVNGEAVIFGGYQDEPIDIKRQVKFETQAKIEKTLLRYLSSLNAQ